MGANLLASSKGVGMQAMDEHQQEEIETLHLYISREEIQPTPRLLWLPPAIALFVLSALVTLCVSSPYRQPVMRAVLHVQAVYLPLQTYTTSAQIKATGVKVYPATVAHGTLVITNGSVVAAMLPAGMIFTSNDGTEVITQTSVYVPAGSVQGYGYATVRAQAIQGGKQGNIAALSLNAVYGTSLYVRNLTAFKGGRNAFSVKIITAQDRQNAITIARASVRLPQTRSNVFQAYPCSEYTSEKNSRITLSWACQYVTFALPPYLHITAFQLVGKNVVVETWYRPRTIIFVK